MHFRRRSACENMYRKRPWLLDAAEKFPLSAASSSSRLETFSELTLPGLGRVLALEKKRVLSRARPSSFHDDPMLCVRKPVDYSFLSDPSCAMALFSGSHAACSLQLYNLCGLWRDRSSKSKVIQRYELTYDDGAVDVLTTLRDGGLRSLRGLLRVWELPRGSGIFVVGWGKRDGSPVYVLADVRADSVTWKCAAGQRRSWFWLRSRSAPGGYVLEAERPPAGEVWVLPTSGRAPPGRGSRSPRFVVASRSVDERAALGDASPWEVDSPAPRPPAWAPWKVPEALVRKMQTRALPGPCWNLPLAAEEGVTWTRTAPAPGLLPPLEAADWALGHPASIWSFGPADRVWTKVAPNLLELLPM